MKKCAKDCSRATGVLCAAKYGARKTRNGGKPGFCVSKNAPISSKKNETPEEAFLSAEEKQTVKLLVAEMNESEKTELIYAVGEDWNNITPFLIREFLWRKQNRRSVKNLSEEIKAYEKLGELSQSELEKYLASTASAETVAYITCRKWKVIQLSKYDINIT